MSGFEIAGTILGGLPLLVSAIEHYDDIARPFQRFKNFVPELELFRIQLLLERATFRNDSRILLESLTDQGIARRALDRSLRTNSSLNSKFITRLGDSLDVWNDAIRVIQNKLKVIEKESHKFGLILDEPTPTEPGAQIAWRLRIKQKLKFSFSKSHLDSALTDLRTFTHAFSKLCTQITVLDQSAFQVLDKTIIKPGKRVGDCQKVRRASMQLYDALCKACSMHEKHSAQFRLEPHHVDLDDDGFPLIRFNVAFTRPWKSGEASLSDTAWLAIDSVLGVAAETATVQAPDSGTKNIHHGESLKREWSEQNDMDVKRSKLRKTVAFAGRVVPQIEPLSSMSTVLASACSLPDFCLRRDFCSCVQRYSQYTLEKMDRFIGYLTKSGPCKHLVYFSPPTIAHRTHEPVSLAEMIIRMSQKQRVGGTLPLERVRLAKQLASAVLQFHDTPLLKPSWQSQDVILFGGADETGGVQRQILASPHLNVVVDGKRKLDYSASSAIDVNELLVRNLYLFKLAIVLLEIAYQKPFAKLREGCGVTNVAEGILQDLLVAKQLSERVSAQLGSTYGEVVRKCLHCDFNTGSGDLNDNGLQAVVYKEVVIRLEDLEMAMISTMHSQ